MTAPALLGEPPPPPGRTRIILRNDDRNVLSNVQETDARTALTRGMAEYLEQLSIDFGGGRFFQFKRVFDTWAEPEDEADWPSAAVYSEEAGEYDASKFVGEPARSLPLPSGQFLISSCEFVLDFIVDVWTTDSTERMGLVAMLEEALDPHDFRYGLLLELPHYFNERASYEKMKMAYVDGEDAAQRRVRRAQVHVRGRVPVVRLKTLPGLVPKVRVKVVDGRDC